MSTRVLPDTKGATPVSFRELRANLADYLERANKGEWFAVVDMRRAGANGERGLELARIGPPLVVDAMLAGHEFAVVRDRKKRTLAIETNGANGDAVMDALGKRLKKVWPKGRKRR